MFELAAGQLHQDERERSIAAALRRRQLLEADGAQAGAPDSTASLATAASKTPRRDGFRVPARADR